MKKLLELFVKKQKEDLTATEQQAVDRLQADGQTREEWEQYQQIWERTGKYQAKGFTPNTEARWTQMQQHMQLEQQSTARRFRLPAGLRVAATILLVLFAGLAVRHFWQMSGGAILQTVEATNEHRIVDLPDGSQVRLYAGSQLTYPESLGEQQHREVSLEGVAYFTVEKVPGRTFTVYTAQADIEVLGTRFLVEEHKNTAQTIIEVEEGKIALYPERSRDTLTLTTANRIIIGEDRPLIREAFALDEISTPPQIWQARGNTLSEFKTALTTQSGEVVIFPAHMANCDLTGNLDLSSQHRLLEALRLLGYHATLNDNHELVLAGDCP